jgi:hypothetical protein
MEKNKALLLSQDKAELQYRQSLDLPLEFLMRESELKEQLVDIERMMEDASLSKSTRDSLQKAHVDQTIVLESLQDSVLGVNHEIGLNPELVSLSSMQEELQKDEVLVSYHISVDDGFGIYSNKENGYALFATSDSTWFYEINGLTAFKDSTVVLLDYLRKPFQNDRDRQRYAQLSHWVYTQLFPSEEIRQLVQGKQLKIIPDSYLSLLPYEALSVSSEQPDYLLSHTTISYLYSYSFHQLNKSSSRAQNNLYWPWLLFSLTRWD